MQAKYTTHEGSNFSHRTQGSDKAAEACAGCVELAAQHASILRAVAASHLVHLEPILTSSLLRADNTLVQNEDFWSSTGNPDPESSESLLYRLAPPLCALHSVTIGVYRARYQFG